MTDTARSDRAGQLDAIRAIAVIIVVYSHTMADGHLIGSFNPQDFGYLAVHSFFVLSGFLITGILLRANARRLTGNEAPWSEIGRFYLGRALRLYPVYYLTIGVAFALNIPNVRQEIFWHLTQMTTYLWAYDTDYFTWAIHFWSLSVESQFYFVWPFLIFFLPLRSVPLAIGALVLVGTWSWFPDNPLPEFLINADIVTSLDSLGIGAFVAYAHFMKWQKLEWLVRAMPFFLAFSVIGLLPDFFSFSERDYTDAVDHVMLNLFYASLIYSAYRGMKGLGGWLLDRPTLQYLGRISYAVYAFHMFAIWALLKVQAHFRIEALQPDSVLLFALALMLSVIGASISWRFVEKPLSSLRHAHLRTTPKSA